MQTLNSAPEQTGNATLDAVNQQLYQRGEDERNAVPLQGLSDAAQGYLASIEDPAVKADAAGTPPKTVTLTDDEDDFLPYLQDVEENWDMREQAYQDKTAGKERVPGEVSNEYVLPGRKTVHGLDIATGERILNRDTGIPAAEEAYSKGREQLRESTFNINEGYGVDGVTGLSSIAEGVVNEDKGYADFEKKVDLLGVPPEQARLAWQTGNRQVLQTQIADAIDHEIETNEDTEAVDPPDIEMDQLPTVEGWADSTKVVYEAEEGRPFEGTDDDLVDWYVDQMSSFNWKIGIPGINSQGMAYYMSRAWEEDENYSNALLNMVNTYDRVNTNWDIVGRNLGQVVTDPVNLIGVPGGAALGTKVGGMVAKKSMVRFLTTRMAARGAGVGAAEGGAWAGGSEAMMQQIEQESGSRDDVNYGQIGAASAMGVGVGAPMGATMGVGIPFAAQGTAKVFRTMRKNARKGSLKGPLRQQIGAINPNAASPLRDPAYFAAKEFSEAFSDTSDIAVHNAKVEIYDELYESGVINSQTLIDLKEPGEMLEESLRGIGDNRYWSEILEDHVDDTELSDIQLPTDLWEISKLAKGTTEDIREAGYVLPDGSLLDFSGKVEGGSPGTREVDHRQLDFEMGKSSGTDEMIAFQKAGAVRVDANTGLADMETKPTAKQITKIIKVMEEAEGGHLDMIDNGRRLSLAVDDPSQARGYINRFYSGEDVEPSTISQFR